MIDNFEPDYVINIGVAGGINTDLNIGDVIIGKKLVQYDFDLTKIGDYEKGEICEIGKYIYSDEKLVNLCEEISKEIDINTKIGTIGTADKFLADKDEANKIREIFNADCAEMEGAAIAQVCYLDNIPFLVIRGISDVMNGNNKVDFREFIKSSSEKTAVILKKLIAKL